MPSDRNLVAINVGNSRLQAGLFKDGALAASETLDCGDLPRLVECVAAWWEEIGNRPGAAICIASVHDEVADRLISAVEDQLGVEVFRIGVDIPVPIGMRLDPETITGVDRLLNAAAAYDVVRQACVIVDSGTAVTVDFVDGEGTFHGGAIAPGARMQLKALFEHTSALPDVALSEPDADPFGRSTSQAMLKGVVSGIRGLVWRLVEKYAEAYGAYPIVIATGGDAALLFEHDELVDRIVPTLTLLGIAGALRSAVTVDDGDGDGRS